jgi:hypothetical protein
MFQINKVRAPIERRVRTCIPIPILFSDKKLKKSGNKLKEIAAQATKMIPRV